MSGSPLTGGTANSVSARFRALWPAAGAYTIGRESGGPGFERSARAATARQAETIADQAAYARRRLFPTKASMPSRAAVSSMLRAMVSEASV